MKAISIDINNKKVQEIDIEMQANTVYTFFSSILIDEFSSIKGHTIHTDANALSENKRAYFIGEQLLIGDALITSENTMDEGDITIPLPELESLISYEINDFYSTVLELLSSSDINIYRAFNIESKTQKVDLNTEWVLYTFNIADDRTKDYFINELKKSILANEELREFMKKMATLAINAA